MSEVISVVNAAGEGAEFAVWELRREECPCAADLLGFLRERVEGAVDVVAVADLPVAVDVWVNDEGLLEAKAWNPAASALPGTPLVGNAVITGRRGSATVGLPGPFVDVLEESLSRVIEMDRRRTADLLGGSGRRSGDGGRGL